MTNEEFRSNIYDFVIIDDSFKTVFLIDEEHKNDLSTDLNIEIAKHLIDNESVDLVGVESHDGQYNRANGLERDTNVSVIQEVDDRISINNYDRFAQAIKAHIQLPKRIVGIESKELYEGGKDVGHMFNGQNRNPFHFCRSVHFLRVIFDAYIRFSFSENIILNCGSHHNEDILKIARAGSIDVITEIPTNYIIIRNNILRKNNTQTLY